MTQLPPDDLNTEEPEESEEPAPDDLKYQNQNIDLYLDERYRMLAEIVELFLRYSPPMTRYNQVIGALVDESNELAQFLSYETVEQMSQRIRLEIEAQTIPSADTFDAIAGNETPPADLNQHYIGLDDFQIDPPFGLN